MQATICGRKRKLGLAVSNAPLNLDNKPCKWNCRCADAMALGLDGSAN